MRSVSFESWMLSDASQALSLLAMSDVKLEEIVKRTGVVIDVDHVKISAEMSAKTSVKISAEMIVKIDAAIVLLSARLDHLARQLDQPSRGLARSAISSSEARSGKLSKSARLSMTRTALR